MEHDRYLPAAYRLIQDLDPALPVFLVGGAVRDLLLARQAHDLDFALPEGTVSFARKTADALGGAFFILDRERKTARVILPDSSRGRVVVDFARFRGGSIEEDLRGRDFTITSLGLDLRDEKAVIDPVGGVQDLRDQVLRLTAPSSLADDPLRCLRAARLAAQFRLKIPPETRTEIRKQGSRLAEISPERIRDELFRLLEGPNQALALQLIDAFRLSKPIWDQELIPGQIRRVRILGQIWDLFLGEHSQERSAGWQRALLTHRLGRFREQIAAWLQDETVPGRTIYQLSFQAVLTAGKNKASAGESRLPLSNQEWKLVDSSTAGADMIRDRFLEEIPEPLAVYRYFRDYRPGAELGVFLFLAGEAEKLQDGGRQENWIAALDASRQLLEGRWQRVEEWIQPLCLVDGDDLQRELGLEPGPVIGTLLEAIREAQVEGMAGTREEALIFARRLLQEESPADG